MIKKWSQFIKEFVNESVNDIIDVKMNEIKDLIDNASDGQNILYEWESKDDHQLLINFTIDDESIRYEFDIDDLILTKICNGEVKFQENLETVDEGLEIIEKDIQNILGINERLKSQIYKGRKIPGKYLTKNPGKMKKEIDTFRGKKIYKKDWDADYESGKAGVGKRVKTKKSTATKTYERMFGKNKKK